MSIPDEILSTLVFLLALLLTVVGYFFTRTMQQLDASVGQLTAEVSGLKEERKAQNQLNAEWGRRLERCENELAALRREVASLDKILYKTHGPNAAHP